MPSRRPDDTELAIAATAASDSQQTVGTLAPPGEAPILPRGTAIGKYVVLDVLGSGAMGVVVSAIDPTLDRRVAIKLVKADRGGTTTGQQRLLREAQAMARLAHPNVVTVFEAGTFGERVFLAMEYIAGSTLAGWLTTEHAPREIIDAFVAAGRGLAAAHAAGIVHRDFKPANVLVARDGRVCVADFGLATAPEARADSAPPPAEVGDLNMTATGAILGTPAYMSPEQHRGIAATAQADQFAFCVALWEALRGELPFDGKAYVDYADNVIAGRVRDTGKTLPARLKKVLARGLAAQPGERYPDMDTLLEELTHDPTRRLKIGAIAVGVVALAAAGAGLAIHRSAGDPCGAIAVDDIWTVPVQTELRTAFGASHAAEVARIAPLFAQRDREVREARRDACVATEVRHDQSAELLDKRMRCLDRRASETRGVLAVLSDRPDRRVIDKSAESVLGLVPIAECNDRAMLMQEVEAPPPALRPQVVALDVQLDRVRALVTAGNPAAADQLAARLTSDADRIAYVPIQARAHFEAAVAKMTLEKYEAAATELRRAGELSSAARDDRLVARSWTNLYQLVGGRLSRISEARALEPIAAAAVLRAGNTLELRGLLDAARATVTIHSGDYAGSVPLFATAKSELEKALGPKHPMVTNVINGLGAALESAGRYDEAKVEMERALAIRREVLGEDNLLVADSHYQLGALLDITQHPTEALAELERALAIQLKVVPPDHLLNAEVYISLGVVLVELGRPQEALADELRGTAILRRNPEDSRGKIGTALLDLGNAYRAMNRVDEAITAYNESISVQTEMYGADNVHLGDVLVNLGMAYEMKKDNKRAVVQWQRVLEIREKGLGREHPEVAKALGMLIEDDYNHDRYKPALVKIDRAIAILEHAGKGEMPLEFSMHEMRAYCLAELDQPREAIAELDIATAGYTKLGRTEERARVEAFRAKLKQSH